MFSKLTQIENELVENQKRMNEIDYIMREGDYASNKDPAILGHEYEQIVDQNKVLELKRKYLLDRWHGWKQRIFWDIAAPVIITIITAYLLNNFR